MPNHVVNELVWSGITADQRAALLAAILGPDGKVDFNVLVPMPRCLTCGSCREDPQNNFAEHQLSNNHKLNIKRFAIAIDRA